MIAPMREAPKYERPKRRAKLKPPPPKAPALTEADERAMEEVRETKRRESERDAAIAEFRAFPTPKECFQLFTRRVHGKWIWLSGGDDANEVAPSRDVVA